MATTVDVVMTGRPGKVAAVLLAASLSLAVAGCSSSTAKSSAKSTPVALTGAALANQRVGAACSWLAGAEKRPAGSDQAAIGQSMLAHAGTLAITAADADARWKSFATDLGKVGQTGGQPALDRVSAVCAQWAKDRTYYLKHPPRS